MEKTGVQRTTGGEPDHARSSADGQPEPAYTDTARGAWEARYAELAARYQALKNAHHELSLQSAAGLNAETIRSALLCPGYQADDPVSLLPALRLEYRLLGAWIRSQVEQIGQCKANLDRLVALLAQASGQQTPGVREILLRRFRMLDSRVAAALQAECQELSAFLQNIPLFQLATASSHSDQISNAVGPPDPPSPFYPTLCVLAGTSSQQPRVISQVRGRGTVPFNLTSGVRLIFDVYCPEDLFCGFDLLLATHQRVNPSRVQIQVFDLITEAIVRTARIDALEVVNNCFYRVVFEPLEKSAGQTWRVSMTAADSHPDAFIAVWCHPQTPAFHPDTSLQPPSVPLEIHKLPLLLQEDLLEFNLSSVLLDRNSGYAFILQGLTPEIRLFQLQSWLWQLEKALRHAGQTGQVLLCGTLNDDLAAYCRKYQLPVNATTDWIEGLQWAHAQLAAEVVWLCNIMALPSRSLVIRTLALFDASEHTAALVPAEHRSDNRLRAAFGLLQQNGLLVNPLSYTADAAHPWLGYRRAVDATFSELLIVRSATVPEIEFEALAQYRTRAGQFSDLIQQFNQQGHQVLYDARLRYWCDTPHSLNTDDLVADASVFRQRWKAEVAAQPPVYADAAVCFNPRQRPHILVIDVSLPTFDEDSGSLRMYHLLQLWVGMDYRVSFFPADLDSRRKYRYELEALGIEVFHGPYNIHEAFKYRDYDMVWICRVDLGARYIPLVRLLCPRAQILYDTVDIHHVRMARQADIENNAHLRSEAIAVKRQELANCILADHVVTVTQADSEHLQKALPDLPCTVIPNVHPVETTTIAPFEARDGMVFIGNYNHPPNCDAVLAFLEDVFPLVRQALPEAVFYIVGSNMPGNLLKLADAHVRVVGWVPEVAPEFARRRLFVSYLRYGAGMKGKLGQALTLGLPVVTTSIGAEGMGLQHEQTALIADDARAFAESIIRLYSDSSLWSRLSRQGLQYIDAHYGNAAVLRRLKGLMEECMADVGV